MPMYVETNGNWSGGSVKHEFESKLNRLIHGQTHSSESDSMWEYLISRTQYSCEYNRGNSTQFIPVDGMSMRSIRIYFMHISAHAITGESLRADKKAIGIYYGHIITIRS